MPSYTFKHTKTGKIVEYTMKISEYDSFKKKHPKLERYHASVPSLAFAGRYFGSLDAQTDNGFKEVLAKIGEAHPDSPLADKYRKNKTVADIKKKNIVKKYLRGAKL